jgi:hypothetical protein
MQITIAAVLADVAQTLVEIRIFRYAPERFTERNNPYRQRFSAIAISLAI